MLQLEGVTKRFGAHAAVSDVSLHIGPGEFFALLGPSGCGKTSLLRTIAGIYGLEEGLILLGGADIGRRPMNARDIALVFQNYALFPHLSVFENVAFGLRMRKVPRAELRMRVEEALELVRMSGFAGKKPGQLSGGQQQRVALARAVVVRPSLLLLDEPLSNLDAKLREEMREEVRALQRRIGVTTVLVTHDLQEAFATADRIGVMRDGRLEQVGPPAELYDAPASRFVAGFVGHANILDGEVVAVSDGRIAIRAGGLSLSAPRSAARWREGGKAWATLRPERLRLGPEAGAENRFEAEVADVTFLGGQVAIRLQRDGISLRANAANLGQLLPRVGERVTVSCDEADVIARPEGGA